MKYVKTEYLQKIIIRKNRKNKQKIKLKCKLKNIFYVRAEKRGNKSKNKQNT